MLLEDVIGVQLTKTPPASNPRACEFSIYLYPVVSPLAKKRSRLQCTTIIHFDDSDQFKENFQSASKWKTSILLQTQRAVKATFGEDLKSESGSKISDCKHPINWQRCMLASSLMTPWNMLWHGNFTKRLSFGGMWPWGHKCSKI